MNSLSGSFVSLGNNIVTDARGSAGFVNGVNGDQVSDNNAVDPRLGTLVDNGGQSDTLASLTGSPAIGNANGCILNGNCPQLPGIFVRGMSDQRRVNRRGFTTGVDIGAFNKVDGTSIGVTAIGIILFPPSEIIRYAGSPMILTNARTLEKRFSTFKPMGLTFFSNISSSDDYILEILSKRRGLVTPRVFVLD